jgi:DNA invertase Pin-like site-specific DNA recombinase
MPTAFVYLRFLHGEAPDSEDFLHLRDSAEHFATVMPEGIAVQVCIDQADATGGFLCRPAGRAIEKQVQLGDLVIFPDLARCFRSYADQLYVQNVLERQGVHVAVLELICLSPAEQISQHSQADRARQAENRRASYGKRRKAGMVANQFAGHGFRMAGPKGARYRVPSPSQREIMGLIVGLRKKGLSWHRIAVEFMYAGLEAWNGQEWSVDQVRRAYKAEMALRPLAADSAG